jgi:hypothetical protein
VAGLFIMNWDVIITALITAGGMYFFPEMGKFISARFSKTPQERRDESRNLSAKTESEIVKAANDLVAGSMAASKAVAENLLRSNEYLKQEVSELRTENTALEGQIEAIKEARRIREEETKAERDELQAKIKAELIESRDIRIENAEKEKRIGRLEDIVIRQSEYMDTQNTALKRAGIPVPQNGELLESARRLRLTREERERLKAGK